MSAWYAQVYLGMPWRTPQQVATTDGAHSDACRLCVTKEGLQGAYGLLCPDIASQRAREVYYYANH